MAVQECVDGGVLILPWGYGKSCDLVTRTMWGSEIRCVAHLCGITLLGKTPRVELETAGLVSKKISQDFDQEE